MQRLLKAALGVAVCLLLTHTATAQLPTAILTGQVMENEAPMPGVTVTVDSPALQGTQAAITSANGDYIIRFLPVGTYTVSFSLSGYKTQSMEVKMSAAQTRRLDAQMYPESFAEEIVVTGNFETLSISSQASTTLNKETIDKLPMGRTPAAAVALTAGASTSGPGGNVTISGSQSYENLWLVNGVVVNENLRGQSLALYIEDAIEETTTSTSGISAEYGRFAGGVITTVTKSGGNQFSGSLRANLDNEDWQSLRPGETAGTDKINNIWEGTFGGFVLRDKLWFFLAGRDTGDTVTSNQTQRTDIAYDTVGSSQRYEGKLTFSITPQHRLVGSYIKIDSATTNDWFGNIMDLSSLYNREDPQWLKALNYTGVITDSFFVELQGSKRDYIISKGGGSLFTDRIFGTLLLDRSRSSRRYWSPTFCGAGAPDCPDKERDNENYLAKGSYFLSSDSWGSHDIVFGYDTFNAFQLEENHQSGSDYRIYTSGAYIDMDPIVPIINPSGYARQSYFYYQPQLTRSVGADMKTDSIFVNDTWRFNNKWSFNVGLRYDKNDATDSSGQPVANDSRMSPRLGATFDLNGDGEWIFNANLARYVTGLQGGGNVGDGASQAGLTSVRLWYEGPSINNDPDNLVSTEQALQIFFNWLDSVGGAFAWSENPDNWYSSPSYPGLTPVILQSLDSPYADEYSIGVTKRLGTRGLVRADYVHREFGSFYSEETNLGTGTVTNPAGISVDRTVITNRDAGLERKYDGVHMSGQYRVTDTITVGGSYTWSQSIGNFIGEYSNTGPVRSGDYEYPEYNDASWSAPRGYLPIDQRHRFRGYLSWDALNLKHHQVNVSLVQSYLSGEPYDAAATIRTSAYVTNPGYVSPDSTHTYYFSGRGEYRLDTITRTDLSVTYSLTNLPGGLELYIKPMVTNLFAEEAVDNVDLTVYTAYHDSATYEPFNPWTETPVQGVHWDYGPDFGQPLVPGDYQNPRTFTLAIGLRF